MAFGSPGSVKALVFLFFPGSLWLDGVARAYTCWFFLDVKYFDQVEIAVKPAGLCFTSMEPFMSSVSDASPC